MTVIEAVGLKKEYRRLRGGKTIALDGLDLAVPQGGVFGFLGPNGSGKTTTIRCLLGLVQPTAGTCSLLGKGSPEGLPEVITRVGSIVETPTLFPTFSGRRNLRLLGAIHGIAPKKVDEILELVGLGPRADGLVKQYSLGMKQRLGLGAALLKDPELLILDEPANGLDPAGIKEIRELLRRLGNEGRTVFVSSHILTEIQAICDQVAILARGRCVAAGAVNEVLAGSSGTGVLVRIDNPDGALRVLIDKGFNAAQQGEAIWVDVPDHESATVTKVLAEAGLYLSELSPIKADLETVFLELTRDEAEQQA